MPIRRKHKRVVQFLPAWVPGTAHLLEYGVLAGLFCSFFAFLNGRGGSYSQPESIGTSSVILLVTGILFGFWWRVQPRPRVFTTTSLIFLPWLTWLAFQSFYASRFPSETSVVLGTWMQATGLFLIIVHMGRSRRWLMGLFIVTALAAVLFCYAGISQYSFNHNWVPGGGRPLDWTLGRATGAFLQPSTLAATALLLLPTCYSIAAMRAFSLPTRIGCGALAMLFSCAVLLTADLPACALLAAVALLMPLLFAERWKKRMGLAFAGLGALVLVAVLLGALNGATRAHYRQLLDVADPVPLAFAHRQAVDAFLAHPLVGGGYGVSGINMWGVVPYADNPDFSDIRSEYLGAMASYGLMALALFVPILWLLFLGIRKWVSIPFHKESQEEAFRNLNPNLTPEERARRLQHHHHSSRKHPTPTTKVLLAGACAGVFSALVMCFHASLFQNAAFVFFFMIAAATLVCLTMAGYREVTIHYTGIAGLSLAALWCGIALSVSLTPALSRQHIYSAELAAAQTQSQGVSIQKLIRLHYDTIDECNLALNLDPRNYWARMLRTRTEFRLAALLPSEAEKHMQEGRSEMNGLIGRDSMDWRPRAFLAEALLQTGAKSADVESAYGDLERHAGDSPMAWTIYARYLLRDKARAPEAGQAASRALELLPDFAPASEVRSMLSIGSGL